MRRPPGDPGPWRGLPPIDRLMAYYGADLTGFHLPFNFHLISTDWKPKALASLIEAYEAALPAGGWPNWVLGNHNRSRVASRIGRAQARVAAMLFLTLRGTPTIYQGRRLAWWTLRFPPHLVQDPFELNVRGWVSVAILCGRPCPGPPKSMGASLRGDPGFPSMRTRTRRESSDQAGDPRSMLSLYRALIRLRRDSEALLIGEVRLLAATEHVLAYERRLAGEHVMITLNMTGQSRTLRVGNPDYEIVLSTYLDDPRPSKGEEIYLRADEGLILRAPADDT